MANLPYQISSVNKTKSLLTRPELFKKVDKFNAIHRINLYPLDSAIDFPHTHPLDSAIHLLNNRGLDYIHTHDIICKQHKLK